MTKSILLTGATGHIGARLVRRLLDADYLVTVTQNRRVPTVPTSVGIIPIDDSNAVQDAAERADIVIHAAAYIPSNLRDSAEAAACFEVNALFSLQLAQWAAEGRPCRYIYFASANAYQSADTPVAEQHPQFPAERAPYYLTSKMAGEIFVTHIGYTTSLAVVSLRVSSVYGPGMRPNSVLYRFMDAAAQGVPFEVWDGGLPAMDFVYVDDVVDVTLRAIESDEVGPFNVGSGQQSTLRELGESVLKVFEDLEPSMTIREPHRDLPANFPALDITRAAQQFGYRPRSLVEGLRAFRHEAAQ